MWRVLLSRRFNQLLGGKPDEMFSTRCHHDIEWMALRIDYLFFILRLETRHCYRSYRRDKWYNRRNQRDPQAETHHRETAHQPLQAQAHQDGLARQAQAVLPWLTTTTSTSSHN